MTLNESYFIPFDPKRESAETISELFSLCRKSTDLYNRANYIYRQGLTGHLDNIKEFTDLLHKKNRTWVDKDGNLNTRDAYFISEFDMVTRLRKLNDPVFRSLKSQVAHRVIHKLYMNYKAFYASIHEYAKDPSNFNGRPRPPNYKKNGQLNLVIFTNQCSFVDSKDGHLKLSKTLKLNTVKTSLRNKEFQEVRIVPVINGFKIEIAYIHSPGDYAKSAIKANKRTNVAAIDIGVDNLVTITSDDPCCTPLIIDGAPLKSINQYYNKRRAKLQSEYHRQHLETGSKYKRLVQKRNHKINDYIHKASRRITDWCIVHNVSKLYIGHIKGWKNNCRMGTTNNQKFCSIPFNVLINQLTYKLKIVGIETEIVQEAYTSKCSALDNEEICKHSAYKGKRILRGLFKTENGRSINSDVNGSLNILRLSTNKRTYIHNPFNPIKIKNINAIRDDVYFQWRPADIGHSVVATEFINSKNTISV